MWCTITYRAWAGTWNCLPSMPSGQSVRAQTAGRSTLPTRRMHRWPVHLSSMFLPPFVCVCCGAVNLEDVMLGVRNNPSLVARLSHTHTLHTNAQSGTRLTYRLTCDRLLAQQTTALEEFQHKHKIG